MPIITDRGLWQRLLWFVSLWAGGVLVLGGVAGALKWILYVV